MSMNAFLAEYYNTVGSTPEAEKTASAHTQEDLEKQAQMELFCKIAEENKIDLSAMNDEQLSQLFTATFAKTASEPEAKKEEKKEEEETEEVEKKAAAELQAQHDQLQKIAEADFFGRQMAHAYVDELKKLAAAAAEEEKKNEPPPAKDEKKDGEEKKEEGGDKEKKLPPWLQAKKASALDKLSGVRAIELVQIFNKTASQKLDESEAQDRVNAVLTLGVQDSTKVASAADVSTATHIRALEILEAAGYPVEWPK